MNATKNKPAEQVTPSGKGLFQSLQDFLASIKFSIILLSCIAFGSILGTVIKQGAGQDEYLSLYSEGTYRAITLLGLNDVYHSPWFIALLFLFAINLTLCTLRRFMPLLGRDKKVSVPEESAMMGMSMNFRTANANVDDTSISLILKGCIEGSTQALKERSTKKVLCLNTALLIHTSIMLILIGGFVGLVAGLRRFYDFTKRRYEKHNHHRRRKAS